MQGLKCTKFFILSIKYSVLALNVQYVVNHTDWKMGSSLYCSLGSQVNEPWYTWSYEANKTEYTRVWNNKICVTSTWNTCWKQNFLQSLSCVQWEILRNKQPISMAHWAIQVPNLLLTCASIFTSRLIHTSSVKNKRNVLWLCISLKLLCSALSGTVVILESKCHMLPGTQN